MSIKCLKSLSPPTTGAKPKYSMGAGVLLHSVCSVCKALCRRPTKKKKKHNYPVREAGICFLGHCFPRWLGGGGTVDSLFLGPLLPLSPWGWLGAKGWEIWAVALVMLKYWLQVMTVK